MVEGGKSKPINGMAKRLLSIVKPVLKDISLPAKTWRFKK